MPCLKVTVILLLIAISASKKITRTQIEETFFLPQPMKDRLKDVTLTFKDREDDQYSPWSGGDISPEESTGKPPNFTCPWEYVVVFNPNRIPSRILEASCLSEQCSLPEEDSNSPTGTCRSNSLCSAVRYFRWVKVKNQRRSDGKWNYIKRLLPITVGCTLTLDPTTSSKK